MSLKKQIRPYLSNRRLGKKWLAQHLLAVVVFFVSCRSDISKGEIKARDNVTATLPYFNSADFTPEWEKKIHKIPDFSLTNQNGDTITNETYRGKIYVADFFFTSCPGICPTLTKNMADLQKTYSKDSVIMLLSHSVMPWYDTEKVLKEYAEKNGVNNKQWNLVTGDTDVIYELARNGYFADEDFTQAATDEDFIHTENFVLVDQEGYIRGVYNGTLAIDVQRLKRHINILEKEI